MQFLTVFFVLLLGTIHLSKASEEDVIVNVFTYSNLGEAILLSYLDKVYAPDSGLTIEGVDTLLPSGSKVYSYKRDSIFTDLPSITVIESSKELSFFPGLSIQQSLKGKAAGLYVQEDNGEPGTTQKMFIRGVPRPLLSVRDIYDSQPLIVLDGIPLIGDHPFAYDIQQFDFNRIGTATNLLANIDMDNIEDVQVLKDPASIAVYGPKGANGVILLTTRQAGKQRHISVNSYIGFVNRPSVTTINGDYENSFRRQFYDKYTTTGRYSIDDVYPLYLSDSLNTDYYGDANWTDNYYKSKMVHAFNAGISGGADRANFRFSIGSLRNQGVADDTGIDRYSTMFNVNMKPVKWLLFSAMINGNRLVRRRNKTLRDRFAQMGYIPDLTTPLTPNKEVYGKYLKEYEKGFDNNNNNIIEGYAKLAVNFGKFNITSRLSVDYNEGYRDLFYVSTLMENNSYASNFNGFNQRLFFDNVVTHATINSERHSLYTEIGQSVQWDIHKYHNAFAYKGVNDFIKINLLNSDRNSSNFLFPEAFPKELVYKYLDKTSHKIASFYGKSAYSYKGKYTASFILRADGSSNAQPTSRWFISPTFSLGWDLKKDFFTNFQTLSDFNLRASIGRMGRLNSYDNFAQGPQYTAEIGFSGNMMKPGYNGIATLVRPYNFGWVGYGIPWAYSDHLNIGFDISLKNRFWLSVDYYNKTDKNQLLGIPSYAEFGYSQSYEHGLSVNNQGLEIMLSGNVLPGTSKASWQPSLNFTYSANALKQLPRGMNELVVNENLLKVGKPIDRYWLFRNEGIFNSNDEVPENSGRKLSYNGIELQGGDPRWVDLNNDNIIDDNDRVLMGNSLPKVHGSFINNITYLNWSFNMNLYFNFGRKVLNQEMANRFDFINREGEPSINSVKEITFWEKRGDYSKYPLYNPWSSIIPYRVEQDLFLENASFVKLRSLRVGYDLTSILKRKNNKAERLYLYGSINNVFTITKYSGVDPELIGYSGIDNGYGHQMPRTVTIGFKMEL